MGNMVVGFAGNGLGQALTAVAVALLLRLFSGPGPALLPGTETDEDGAYEENEDDEAETTATGKVIPVTIRWRNITCSLSDKSSKSVNFLIFFFCSFILPIYVFFKFFYLFGCRENVQSELIFFISFFNPQVRFLLKNVTGEAKPGRLLAIMGPSGSGKTTLLNVLAGQLTASPRLNLSGLLEVNGKPSSNKAYK